MTKHTGKTHSPWVSNWSVADLSWSHHYILKWHHFRIHNFFSAKFSILLMYLRIFNTREPLQRSIDAGLLIMALFYTSMVLGGTVAVVRCVGLAAGTNQFCKNDGGVVLLVQSAINMVTGFWMLIYPCRLCWGCKCLARVKSDWLPCLRLEWCKYESYQELHSDEHACRGFWPTLKLTSPSACGASLARLIEFAVRYHSTDTYWDHAVASEVR